MNILLILLWLFIEFFSKPYISQKRSILTLNRVDFIRLHRCNSNHFGIIVCTNNRNWEQFAARIDEAVTAEETLQGKLIRVVRPVT
ncbi:DUF5615 family PIN-like protein [Nostoc commune]|uniref:DUF5615 family PIN-like protein n=1 Tax=Nostoc commune TaxID=1178 RepID=UPI001C62B819|nr:DUF5615 family PIN-like protein [Nostoc commune]